MSRDTTLRQSQPVTPSRGANDRQHPLRVLRQVQPCEAKDLPAEKGDVVLPLAIDVKLDRSTVKCKPVDFDRYLRAGKTDVDLVSPNRIVRLPTGDTGVAQQLDKQSLGNRARAVRGGLEK